MDAENISKNIGEKIIVILIFIVLFLFIFYDPIYGYIDKSENFHNCNGFVGYYTLDQMDRNIPNIKLVVNRLVIEIVRPLYSNIISDCINSVKLNDINDKITCVVKNDNMHRQIVRKPIIDMFYHLDGLGITPFDLKNQAIQREQRHFAVLMIEQVFRYLLHYELLYIKARYPMNGYNEIDSQNRLAYALGIGFMMVLLEIYKKPLLYKEITPETKKALFSDIILLIDKKQKNEKIEYFDKNKCQSGIQSTESKVHNITCDDIESGKYRINIGGNQLKCVNNKPVINYIPKNN